MHAVQDGMNAGTGTSVVAEQFSESRPLGCRSPEVSILRSARLNLLAPLGQKNGILPAKAPGAVKFAAVWNHSQ